MDRLEGENNNSQIPINKTHKRQREKLKLEQKITKTNLKTSALLASNDKSCLPNLPKSQLVIFSFRRLQDFIL